MDAADHGQRHRPLQPRGSAPGIDHIEHEIGHLVVHAAPRCQAGGPEAENLDEQRAQQHRVLGQAAQVGAQGLVHLGLPVARRVDGFPQHAQAAEAGGFVQRDQGRGLAVELLVEGAARHARLAHDVGDGGVGIALGRHAMGQPVQQPVAVVVGGEVFGVHGTSLRVSWIGPVLCHGASRWLQAPPCTPQDGSGTIAYHPGPGPLLNRPEPP